jgi:L-aspartate oxidase
MPLISEALRGEGAFLIDENGDRFTDELQPRDIVARAIAEKQAGGHHVFLDATRAIGEKFAVRFPTIHHLCLSAHIDPARQPIPVRPAAHYHMGGVRTDAQGRTDIPGLWACGEVACTGLHGANRLASNSLLEAASFGARVALDIKNDVSWFSASPEALEKWNDAPVPRLRDTSTDLEIRKIMSEHVGVVRDQRGLQKALTFLSPHVHDSDMALVASLIILSALRRQESRGAHYRSDYPLPLSSGQRSSMRLIDLEITR